MTWMVCDKARQTVRQLLWVSRSPMKSASLSGPIGWFVPSLMPLSMSSALPTPCNNSSNHHQQSPSYHTMQPGATADVDIVMPQLCPMCSGIQCTASLRYPAICCIHISSGTQCLRFNSNSHSTVVKPSKGPYLHEAEEGLIDHGYQHSVHKETLQQPNSKCREQQHSSTCRSASAAT